MFASFRRFWGEGEEELSSADPASRLVKSLSRLMYKQMENLLDQLRRGYNRGDKQNQEEEIERRSFENSEKLLAAFLERFGVRYVRWAGKKE